MLFEQALDREVFNSATDVPELWAKVKTLIEKEKEKDLKLHTMRHTVAEATKL